MKKDITKFINHIDNSNEIISAKHVNELATAINQSEKRDIELADEQFRSHVFFSLESSLFANSMFMDDLKTPYKIFKAQCTNLKYIQDESCIQVEDGSERQATFTTVKMSSQYITRIGEFAIVTDEYVPKGASIKYYISADGYSFFPIKPNISEETVLKVSGNNIFLRAVLNKNANYESPKLYGWAILYRDPIVDKTHGLANIDLSRLENTIVGETMLFRDPENGDRLQVVITPDSMTELHYDSYDEDGEYRLSHILERIDDRIIKQNMNYGPYKNSEGAIEDVLLGITASLENPAGGGNT